MSLGIFKDMAITEAQKAVRNKPIVFLKVSPGFKIRNRDMW